MKKVLGNKRYILILSAPALILMAAFVLYPLINIVIMSLQETNGLTPAVFVGFENFVKIFQDSSFLKANIWSIGLCLLAVIFNAVLAIAVSILLSTLSPRAQKILRTALLFHLSSPFRLYHNCGLLYIMLIGVCSIHCWRRLDSDF